MKRTLLLLSCGLLALSACGSDDGGKSNNTANNSTNNNVTNNNATNNNVTNNNVTNNNATNNNVTNNNATNNNATNNNGTNNTNNVCDINGFEVGFTDLGVDGTTAYLYAATTEGEPNDFFSLEFIETAAGPSPLDNGVGTYEFGATTDDQNYETCQTCLLMGQNCTANAGCDSYFLATSGSVEITAVDLASNILAGRLVGAELEEVTVDFDTYISTPVANGASWCVADVAFDTTPECVVDADCLDAAKGICSDNVCVACASSFDCADAAAPACLEDATTGDVSCGAVMECTGDDANEEDDGPAGAKALVSGTPFAGGICEGTAGQESDWFKITITEASTVDLSLTVTDPAVDIDLYLADTDGNAVASSAGDDAIESIRTGITTPGTYYVIVAPYDTQAVGGGLAAAQYTLTYTATAAECVTDMDCTMLRPFCNTDTLACVVCLDDEACTDASAPVCITQQNNNVCGSYDECTGDDNFEPNSDGPGGASEIVIPSTTNARICGDSISGISENEADWFKFTLAAPTDVRVTLAWTVLDMTTPDPDLDIAIFDSTFTFVDSSVVSYPEIMELPALAADTYYVKVVSYESSFGLAAQPYSVQLETYTP
jgi:hypothetical protein